MSQNVRPVYRFADNATESNSNEFGNYILKRGGGEIRKPSWNRTDTVVRFLPQWDFEANQWSPFRLSPEPMQFGDWIRSYTAVRGFGETGITMLLYDPVTNPAYDLNSNPCVLLHKAISASIDNHQCEPDWPSLLKGGPGRKAALSRHGKIFLARCAIFRIKSKDMATADRSPLGMAPRDPGYFLELPKTAGEKLTSMLEERNPENKGDPEDYDDYFKYGDIVSLDKGSYVTIFEEGASPKNNVAVAPGSAPRQLTIGGGGMRTGGGSSVTFKGFDMYIEKMWNGYGPELNTPDLAQLIKSKQKPWEDCLQFFSHQEQAFLVQDGFPAKAILYAWRDHPEWIKDETRSKAVGRVSATVEPPVVQQAPQSYAPPRQPVISATAKAGGWGDKQASDVDNVVPSVDGATEAPESTEVKLNRGQKALEEAQRRNKR